MRLDAISIGTNPPHDVNVVIEVPIGGEPIKYEMDKDAGTLVVDRFLYTAMRYPGNYGFVPHTLSGDGDPCDVLVANTRAIAPGAIMSVRPVGVLVMEDNARRGREDHRSSVAPPHATVRPGRELHATCPTSRSSRSSTSSSTTRTWNPASGSRSCAGATRRGAPADPRGDRAGQEGLTAAARAGFTAPRPGAAAAAPVRAPPPRG